MFNARKTEEIERTDTQVVQFSSPTAPSQSQIASRFTVRRTLTVGAAGLSRRQYAAMAGILASPKIDWWNPDTSQWTSIVVDNQSLTWDTESAYGSTVFTFLLPRTLLQL